MLNLKKNEKFDDAVMDKICKIKANNKREF